MERMHGMKPMHGREEMSGMKMVVPVIEELVTRQLETRQMVIPDQW